MKLSMAGLWSTVWLVALTAGLCAQAGTPAPTVQAQQRPTFKVEVDLVTTDVIPRDEKGNFIADLVKNDFQIYEDGVRQDLTSMTLSHGGRVTNLLAPPPAPLASEGIILPPTRPVSDVSGRIFVFFVDDLHLQFRSTPRVRELFKKISKTLVHDGDMFGIVSSGPSSISVQMTYDKRRLDEAIDRMTGAGLTPQEIIDGSGGREGPSEVRYRAHVAFSTINELLQNLEKVHDRRKALVYVSDGYDFIPFQEARLGGGNPSSPFLQNTMQREISAQAKEAGDPVPDRNDPGVIARREGEAFSDADLTRELAEVTREANRANVTMYTIDPRGLVGMSDIDQPVAPGQWRDYISKSQETLRILADDTGGIAVVNQNDFDKALKRIDAETSDYYILGYYSTNPDPFQRRRKIEVRVTRPGVADVVSRKEYVLKPQPLPVSSEKR